MTHNERITLNYLAAVLAFDAEMARLDLIRERILAADEIPESFRPESCRWEEITD